MSEGHGESPADVRSFLPRPGEPVEQYAERLRALHRDLTLVLQAVERGLAAAAKPEEVAPPVPAAGERSPEPPARDAPGGEGEPIEIVPEPAEEPARPPRPAEPARARTPRVEVMPAPSGQQRRHEFEERRSQEPAPSEPPARWATPEDERRAAGDGDSGDGAGGPSGERDIPRPPQRLPARPSAASPQAGEPEWVDRGDEGFTAPTFPAAPAPARLTVSPVVAAAFFLAWLVVVALLVAVLLS